MANIVYIVFVGFLLLFFFAALMARPKMYPYVTVLFLIFVGFLYFSLADILGDARPFDSFLPLFSYADGVDTQLDGMTAVGKKEMYLTLREGLIERLYVMPYDEDNYQKIEKQFWKKEQYGFKVKLRKIKVDKPIAGSVYGWSIDVIDPGASQIATPSKAPLMHLEGGVIIQDEGNGGAFHFAPSLRTDLHAGGH